MGGVAGHMNHLYDNPSLKFSQMKDIFTKASNGELEGTEKTDGQNIFLSYSVQDGEARAARNKGDIKKGGMNAQELSSKFAGRDSLQAAFDGAMEVWFNAISNINPRTQAKIFGKDANVWFNAEVQDPGTANVVNYDNKNLVIHQAGHALYDKETGKAKNVDVSKNAQWLNKNIEKVASGDDEGGWKIVNNAVMNLRALDNDKAAITAIQKLETLLDKSGISDSQTVGDYIATRLNGVIDKQIPGLEPKTKEALIGKLTGQKGLNINQITKPLPPAHAKKVKLLANNSKEVMKKIIFPLESIVHDFTVEMLRGLESVFVLDNQAETERLRKEVEQAISVIQQSGEDAAIEILNQQLKKLKKAENVSTAVEGFVFTYDDVVYKFTGNFAPINQILGLFRFGRGKIPPMKHLVKESAKNRIIALVPGGYKPPHVGHYLQAKYFSDIQTVDEVLVLISPKSRFDATKTVEITAKQSLEAWGVFAKQDPKIKAKVAEAASPVKAVFDYLENNANPGDKILLGVSDKEAEESSARYKNVEKFVKSKGLDVEVDVVATPIIRMSAKDVSATDLREMISQGRKEDFVAYMPNHLSQDDREQVWHIMAGNKQNDMGVGNPEMGAFGDQGTPAPIIRREQKEQVEEDKEYTLDEMSAMAAGGAEGYAGIIGMEKPRKRKKTYKEAQIMTREAFLEELKVREAIRECILDIHAQSVKKQINEEIQFREAIRAVILKEASDIEETPHDSTGINVLEDLLKKIVPIIEQGYKSLTTKKEQRTSFRAHILNAIQKSITQADITDKAGAIDVMAEQIIDLALESLIEDDIDIKVGDEPQNSEKFIDIDGPKKDNEEDKKAKFAIDGEDETGRDMAQKTYEKVEGSLLDSYSILSDPEDKKLFYDYLLANVKLYFDKFESELSPALGEPRAGDEAAEDTLDDFEGDEIEPVDGGEDDLVPEL